MLAFGSRCMGCWTVSAAQCRWMSGLVMPLCQGRTMCSYPSFWRSARAAICGLIPATRLLRKSWRR